MTRPRVGEESTDHRAICAWSATPISPQCTATAELHIRVISLDYGDVVLASCHNHAPIARATGIQHGEHPFTHYCGLPGTLWHPTRCEVDVASQRIRATHLLDNLDAAIETLPPDARPERP